MSDTATRTDDAPRNKQFLLARAEGRVLEWIARRLPARVMPDHMTALGVLAAIGIAGAYLRSNGDKAWLWAASALLVVHWLGDSLDGTLARVRKIERPKYGYYLDHLVDAIATALIGLGLGLSPWMLLSVGLLIVIAYLVLSINTYLETHAFGVFTLGYGRLGPTEVRLVLIGLNTLIALGVGLGFQVGGLGLTVLDLIGIGIAAVMALGLAARAASNLRRLAELEPAGAAAARRWQSSPPRALSPRGYSRESARIPTSRPRMSELVCPKCESPMRSYERNGVTIDQCTGCRGVFLDRGELERLVDAEGSFYEERGSRSRRGAGPPGTRLPSRARRPPQAAQEAQEGIVPERPPRVLTWPVRCSSSTRRRCSSARSTRCPSRSRAAATRRSTPCSAPRTSMLREVEQHDPRAVVLCFGPDAADYRVELFDGYHADRPEVPEGLEPQFADARAFFEAFGWVRRTTTTRSRRTTCSAPTRGARRRTAAARWS